MKPNRLLSIPPLLRFGVIADVQYADNDDKKAWYDENKTRFYRNSLRQIEKAFNYWKNFSKINNDNSNGDGNGNDPSNTNSQISFILQLGDLIDALNKSTCSHSAIHRTLNCFLNNPSMPTYHTVGNHELYNFDRPQLCELFDKFLFKNPTSNPLLLPKKALDNDSASLTLYYKFQPIKGVKFISLDTYDISVLGYEETHPNYKLAAMVLKNYHGHEDFQLWDTDGTLQGLDRRFQSSNGALSEQQLEWLEQELTESDANDELVILFGHVGIHPNSCDSNSLLWNYDRILDCFKRHNCVVAYFNGHAHNSGYAFENNVHFIVLHGIVETPPEQEAFTTVSIMDNQMIVDGRGVEKTIIIDYHKKFSLESTPPPTTATMNNNNNIVDVPDIFADAQSTTTIADFHCNEIKIVV